MEVRDMVRMANQIADFFKAYPEDQAVKEVANHLRSFWEPNMRKHLFSHIAKGGAGLSPLVVKAAQKLQEPA
jgi:formate dehydrogenase subunit delta